jgi:hypothetical protein
MLLLVLGLLAPPVQEVLPRAGIRGIAGFTAVSEVTYAEAPGSPELLEASYVFPDRARWSLSIPQGRETLRQISTRLGRRAWIREAQATSSRELEGEDRDVLLLQTELRRAAFLWPDGFAWAASEDGTRRAPVSRTSASGDERIGELVATLGADGRPTRLAALRADGGCQEELAIAAWTEARGRTWPSRLALLQGGRTVWEETLVEVDTRVSYGDLFFSPPESRGRGVDVVGEVVIVSTDLSGFTSLPCELAGGSSWDEWTALAAARIAEEEARLAPQGLAVDPVPTFELGPEGKPSRLWVRLASREARPPEGWSSTQDRPGLALVLQDPAVLGRDELALLERAAPEDAREGTPYARVVGTKLQVYLPLEPAEPR